MTVQFHFYYLAELAEGPDEMAAKIIGGIHKQVHGQVDAGGVLDGLAYNVTETSNESAVESYTDRQIEGRVFFNYQYSHKIGSQTEVR